MYKMVVSSSSMTVTSQITLLFRVESFKQVVMDIMSSIDHTYQAIMHTHYRSAKYLLYLKEFENVRKVEKRGWQSKFQA